eukprot:TRINITY_DN3909_c1_g1_i1.p1 TRINITY_DN3909_c1_g1~~TRINITY_DN3909_c1_g1_i1.p1  ORF type:complete len:347 (+),score=63.73 TRINITY_DN3909_c1_g1_i1:139-1179(+)
MKLAKVVVIVVLLSVIGLYGVLFQPVESALPRDEKETIAIADRQQQQQQQQPVAIINQKQQTTSSPPQQADGSYTAESKHPSSCKYTSGEWVGNLTWVPSVTEGCEYKNYTQEMAFKCLAGKQLILIGNSNMRAMYSALEGVLKNKIITPRLEAKQTCENNQKNHSCGMTVSLPGYKDVRLWYWGYVKGVYNHRIPGFFKYEKSPHVVMINSGLNVIQKVKEKDWRKSVISEAPQLRSYIKDSFDADQTSWYWMTTTRICEDQPHFKKYLYKPKYWLHRSLSSMNSEVEGHNKLVLQQFSDSGLPVIDAAQLASPPSLCPYYDDPLHHKSVDKVLATIFLNNYCNS